MSESFTPSLREDMERAVRHICRGIRGRRARRQAEQEYMEHVEDHAYRLMLRGIPEEKAVAEAIAALGDPENLCHMLCTVHNRLPPEFGANFPWFLLRFFVAWYVGVFLWSYYVFDKHPILQVIPLFLLFGYAPLRYMRSFFLRVRMVTRLRRVCKKQGYRVERAVSPVLSVFFPARRPEWMIHTPDKTYCIHFLAVHNRHATLRLLDSYVYTLTTTHGQAARLVERPMFNRFRYIRTGDNTYENINFHSLHFPLGVDCAAGGAERVLLLCPVPSVIQYRKGTAFAYAGNGDRVFGMTLYDGRSLENVLKRNRKG